MVLKTEDMVTRPSTDLHTELGSLPKQLPEKTATVRSEAQGGLEIAKQKLKLHCYVAWKTEQTGTLTGSLS